MRLFGSKNEKKCCCNCAENQHNSTISSSVKVLGSGCAKCNSLEEATRLALEELGMDTTIEHVTDFAVIATYGVMSTPALVVDDKVISYGKVLTKDEVKALIQKVRG